MLINRGLTSPVLRLDPDLFENIEELGGTAGIEASRILFPFVLGGFLVQIDHAIGKGRQPLMAVIHQLDVQLIDEFTEIPVGLIQFDIGRLTTGPCVGLSIPSHGRIQRLLFNS